jgi:hypothetical protein
VNWQAIYKLSIIYENNFYSLSEYYNPICLEGNTYFTPCHAGCQASTVDQFYYNVTDFETSATNYTECACADSMQSIAVDGECEQD